MQSDFRQALVNLFELSEEDVNGIEAGGDDEIAAFNELVQQATTRTYQRLLRASAAETQVAETAAEADRLERTLEIVGVRHDELGANARSALGLVSTSAEALQMHHPSRTALIAAAISTSLQGSDRRLRQLQQIAAAARASAQKAEEGADASAAVLRRVQADLDAAEARVEAVKELAAGFVTKTRHYEDQVAKCEGSLQAIRADPQLQHDRLEALGREVEAMQSEAQQAEAQLAGYRGLPPSLLGAQLELRGMREQLASMRLQLEQSLAHL